MARSRSQQPEHVQEALAALDHLHAEHEESATRIQRTAERATVFIARPRFLGLLALLILAWIGANLAALYLSRRPPDPPPFNALQAVVSIAALFTTILILGTQRRNGDLTDRRERLTLKLSILNEQKSAKIIALLEEMRRDDPTLANRDDTQATAMAHATGPESVLHAVHDANEASAADLRRRRQGD